MPIICEMAIEAKGGKENLLKVTHNRSSKLLAVLPVLLNTINC